MSEFQEAWERAQREVVPLEEALAKKYQSVLAAHGREAVRIFEQAALTAAAFDESKHPRNEKGKSEGGRFKAIGAHGTDAESKRSIEEDGIRTDLATGAYGTGFYMTEEHGTLYEAGGDETVKVDVDFERPLIGTKEEVQARLHELRSEAIREDPTGDHIDDLWNQKIRKQYDGAVITDYGVGDKRRKVYVAYEPQTVRALTAAGEQRPLPGTVPDELIPPEKFKASIRARTAALRKRIVNEIAALLLGDLLLTRAADIPVYEVMIETLAAAQAEYALEAQQDAVSSVILDAYQEGWSVPETADELRKVLKDYAPWQATRLARTDLISLANATSLTAAQGVEGGPRYKIWLSAQDDRVRPTHVEANRQAVPLEQPFMVEGVPMMYPGDPTAPPELIMNCRCTQVYADTPNPVLRHSFNGGNEEGDELALAADGNPYHEPKGTRVGGRFAKRPGGGDPVETEIESWRRDGLDEEWIGLRRPYLERGQTLYRGMVLPVPTQFDMLGEATPERVRWAIEHDSQMDWGLGSHWTTERNVAEQFARVGNRPDLPSYGVVVEAKVLPESIISEEDYRKYSDATVFGGRNSGEFEVPVAPGSEVLIRDVKKYLQDGEVLEDPERYDGMLVHVKDPALESVLQAAGFFDETKHPRHGAGDERGGEFEPKEGDSSASVQHQAEKASEQKQAAEVELPTSQILPVIQSAYVSEGIPVVAIEPTDFENRLNGKRYRVYSFSSDGGVANPTGYVFGSGNILKKDGTEGTQGTTSLVPVGGIPKNVLEELKRVSGFTAAGWNATKHPRHQKGTDLGGQFAPSQPFIYLPDSVNGGHVKLPAVYLRFGDLPVDEAGNPLPSMNNLTGERENGTSVYLAWHDPRTDRYVLQSGSEQLLMGQADVAGQERKALLVTGRDSTHSGDDGEPLLHPNSVRVQAEVSYDRIVTEVEPRATIDGTELPEEEWPDWSMTSAGWNATLHPRHQKGHHEGGQFAPKDGTSSATAQTEAYDAAQEKQDLEAPVNSDVPSDVDELREGLLNQDLTDAERDAWERAYRDGGGWWPRTVKDWQSSEGEKLREQMATAPIIAAGSFDEEKHPRHEKGLREGGRFASKTDGKVSDPDLEGYVANSFDLNAGLRGDRDLTPDEQELVGKLDTLIEDHGDVATEDFYVYRGVPTGNEPNERQVQDAFLSSTLDPDEAENFTHGDGSVLKIRVPEGRRYLKVGNEFEGGYDQQEVIFPRGSVLIKGRDGGFFINTPEKVAPLRPTGGALNAAAVDFTEGSMIALYPERPELLAQYDGTPPDDLHVTLAFLPEGYDGDTELLTRLLAGIAGTAPVLDGQVGGVGYFEPGEDGVPMIAIPDVDGMAELRQSVIYALEVTGTTYSRSHGWAPHITLTYTAVEDPETPDVIGIPLRFTHLSLVAGPDKVEFPFGQAVTAAASDAKVPTNGEDMTYEPKPDAPVSERVVALRTLLPEREIAEVLAAEDEWFEPGVFERVGASREEVIALYAAASRSTLIPVDIPPTTITFSPQFLIQVPQGPAPTVHVSVPEQAPQEAPVIEVNLPSQEPPVVQVNVPEAPAPVVQVDVAAPEINIPATQVTVEAAKAPNVRVVVPEQGKREVVFKRDSRDRIISAEIEED